jgi:hypothetical protein
MIRQSVSGLAIRSCALFIWARSDAKPAATFADRARAGRFVLDVRQTARLIQRYKKV